MTIPTGFNKWIIPACLKYSTIVYNSIISFKKNHDAVRTDGLTHHAFGTRASVFLTLFSSPVPHSILCLPLHVLFSLVVIVAKEL